ncbi:hypothetical protein OB955_02060 [Halobacteria archaeon AArc-m2/3/4]|uniref:Uncharacterized protein n=1 Tax=Natronoglomus mannanivorans TaxID=2979990 RepID=A0ABT2Q9C4_9EURY|nr:hypothetical protein [Halobacteria archaeon AArc-m2/3/4]
MTFTRRRLLIAAATGGTATTAGCLDSTTPSSEAEGAENGTETETETGTETEIENETERPTQTSLPLYERWLPARESRVEDEFSFLQIDHTAFRAADDNLTEDVSDPVTEDETISELGIDPASLESTLWFGGSLVLSGSFDPASVTAAVESHAESVDDRDTFTTYDGVTMDSIDDGTVAVGPATVVVQGDGLGPLLEELPGETVPVETLLETATGDRADRLFETDTDAEALLEAVHSEEPATEGSSVLYCELFDEHPDAPAAATGVVIAWTFAGERTHLRFGFVFESDAAVDLEATTAAAEATFDLENDDTETVRIGRTTLIAGTIATDEFDAFGSSHSTPAAPQAGISVDVDAETNEGTVTLVAINRLDTLRILVDGDEVREIDDPAVGESYTVEGESGETLTVVGAYEGTESVIYSREL